MLLSTSRNDDFVGPATSYYPLEDNLDFPLACLIKKFFFLFYLFMRNTERERQRHRQREKQAPRREPDVGLNPRTPGSRPGLKAALNR